MKPNRKIDQPIVAFDLEGTITSGKITQAMMDYLATFMGVDVRNEEDLSLLDVLALFRGVSSQEFSQMAEWAVKNELLPKIRETVFRELIDHRDAGRTVIIVSAMFEPVLEALSKHLDDIHFFGTPLAFENNIFTGKIAGELNTGPQKVERLQPFLSNGKIFAAYGDTVADIPMLEMSENPTAVNPDAALYAKAVQNQWRIITDQSQTVTEHKS